MDSSEDSAWVFDSLIGFLHGPIWNAPLQTFIEEKSLIFEPTDEGKICDKTEYMAIFNEYKTMVDLMLGSYMEDIGITPEQFEIACQMSKDNVDGLPPHFHRRLFEQIWAANDYAVFTRMMTQKNVELQLQALELIERRSGMVPNSYLPNDGQCELEDHDAAIMEEVKKLSLDEENEDYSTGMVDDDEPHDLVQQKNHLKSALEMFQHKILSEENSVEVGKDIKMEELKCNELHQNETVDLKPQKEDLIKRQQYLKRQRDKLLTLKRQIREKQLTDSAGSANDHTGRPKSSSAAKMMLAGESPNVSNDSSLQLRRALAERLRTEVVDKF